MVATLKITGRIMPRKDIWYVVLNLKDEEGRSKSKWISTGLKVKGNKTKANIVLEEMLDQYNNTEYAQPITSRNHVTEPKEKILFADYLYVRLEACKDKIRETTYGSYECLIDKVMYPYFLEKGIYIDEITKDNIEEYYSHLKTTRNNCQNTINHHHAMINATLKHALKKGLVSNNVAELVDRDKVILPPVKYFLIPQIKKMLESVHDTAFEIIVVIAIMYGLRRSETLGIKWSAIDNNILMINHTVVIATTKMALRLLSLTFAKQKKVPEHCRYYLL